MARAALCMVSVQYNKYIKKNTIINNGIMGTHTKKLHSDFITAINLNGISIELKQ